MYITARFFFDSFLGAVDALEVVLRDARDTNKLYSFGPLSADQVFRSGLLLVGDAEDVASKVDKLGSNIRYDQ
jgi:hypothetical protein